MLPEPNAPDRDMDIGKKKLLAVREELRRFNIGIAAEDVGGDIGRTVLLDTRDGSVVSRNCLLASSMKYYSSNDVVWNYTYRSDRTPAGGFCLCQ